VDAQRSIRHDVVMTAYTRCAALLRDGTPCGRTVAAGSEFCAHHTKLLATTDAETMRRGRTPKERASKKQMLRVVTDCAVDLTATTIVANAGADPATVRPSFAAAAAENVDQLTSSLLEAAGSAVKPVWLTVECVACGERARIEAPIPDVRARVAAIELLLREGLGRAPQADETPSARLPTTVNAVKEMGWDEMQAVFAALYVDEMATVQHDGGESLVREKLAELSEDARRVLRDALLEPAFS
jgi:hypothetical protein